MVHSFVNHTHQFDESIISSFPSCCRDLLAIFVGVVETHMSLAYQFAGSIMSSTSNPHNQLLIQVEDTSNHYLELFLST